METSPLPAALAAAKAQPSLWLDNEAYPALEPFFAERHRENVLLCC
jgi:hypothetical protein